jgi:exopolysaccharide production protein ExoY
VPLLEIESTPKLSHGGRATQILDRTLGLFLAGATAPLLIGSAAAITILSRRSPFIAHLRVGQHGKPLWVWKLRTMWTGDDDVPESFSWIEKIVADPKDDRKDADDPRVTSRFAAFCRRYSIDELPQFWHAVRGEMSLVGPRPLTRAEIRRHYGSYAEEVLAVKPGLTGLWQVQGRSRVGFPARAALDLDLARDRSLRTYLKILVRTIPAVFGGKSAW